MANISAQLNAAFKLSPGTPPVTNLEVSTALAHLCVLKRTATFSDSEIAVWHSALVPFPAVVINRAVVELCLTPNRFPEFADLYALCKKYAKKAGLMPDQYQPNGDGSENLRITKAEIVRTAGVLGLDVGGVQ